MGGEKSQTRRRRPIALREDHLSALITHTHRERERMFGFGGRGAATAAGALTCSRHANGLAFRASVRGCAVRGAPAHNVADAAGAAKVETTSRVKLRFKRMGRKKRPFYRLV